MKLPAPPPDWQKLMMSLGPAGFAKLAQAGLIAPEVSGEYLHWDKLRYLTPPEGIDHEQWWLALKFSRMAMSRELPLRDKNGYPFRIALGPSLQRRLFLIARDAAGALKGAEHIEDRSGNARYLIRSLMEEAMTSSQLEGAATTTQVAKDMLRSGRQPRDYGERMIYNNYATMRELKHWIDKPLTPERVFEIHRMLTDETLENPEWAGRFRAAADNIVIEDETGRVLHIPPKADELPARMQALCDFANDRDDQNFLDPVVRAVMIHFQIGYDHPFCDGNGRTARALFYWSMLRSGFWMMEYISISSVLNKAPRQYHRAYLYTESDDSDATYFLDHQLDTIISAIDGLHGYLARKKQSRAQAETLLKPGSALARKLNHRQRALLLHALRHPDTQYTIEEHRRSHDVTYQTARADLLGLADERLVYRHKHGRAFVFAAAEDLPRRLGQ